MQLGDTRFEVLVFDARGFEFFLGEGELGAQGVEFVAAVAGTGRIAVAVTGEQQGQLGFAGGLGRTLALGRAGAAAGGRRNPGNPRHVLVPQAVLQQHFGVGGLLVERLDFGGARCTQYRTLLQVVDVTVVEGIGIGALERQHHLRHALVRALVTRRDTPQRIALND